MSSFGDEWMLAVLAPLVDEGVVEALRLPDPQGRTLWERVLADRLVGEAELLAAMSARCRLPIADLTTANSFTRDALPEALARRHSVIAIKVTDSLMEVATGNPFDVGAEQALAFATGREVRMALAAPPRILDKIDELYGVPVGEGVSKLIAGMEDLDVQNIEDGTVEDADDELAAQEALSRPIIKLVDVLLADGITSRASDIHIESSESSVVVRYRIDGVLRQAMTIPRKAGIPLISRIKIISGLDIADRLRPQDGRARVAVNGKPVDLRISTLPATHGEKVVIRILDTQQTMLELSSLGLHPEDQQVLRDLLNHKEGVILCTGPTGSGKTTTLYACIREILAEGINIVTVEDPVEYRLGKNIVQVQVNEKQGLTFSTALRSILRQDPDVVLVGEIRDIETSQIAIQASLTGHLVLSTLHTNDAPNTVTRLVDMGMEPFKLGAALRGVVAQRLMRRLCSHCRVPQDVASIPPRIKPYLPAGAALYRGSGCSQCSQTGYHGRFSIVEILVVTPEIERLIGASATAEQIGRAAREEGMRTLFECGLRHVLEGHSSIEELLRVADVPNPGRGGPRISPMAPGTMAGGAATMAPPIAVPTQRPEQLLEGIELVDDSHSGEHAVAKPKATVLLVEDEDTLRRVMRDLLEQEGYAVCEARDGAEALEQVDRFAPDVVLLDLNLPNVDGYTVLAQLRSRPATRNLPVLVLSARGDEDNEVRVLRLGATDFLTKPFRPRALSARVEATLQRRA
jgi:type II secretory ATPase GspE/PulE/Tfp pilus assembly ATPase PilB-like protein/ActR/RegA family two-component response regulator